MWYFSWYTQLPKARGGIILKGQLGKKKDQHQGSL